MFSFKDDFSSLIHPVVRIYVWGSVQTYMSIDCFFITSRQYLLIPAITFIKTCHKIGENHNNKTELLRMKQTILCRAIEDETNHSYVRTWKQWVDKTDQFSIYNIMMFQSMCITPPLVRLLWKHAFRLVLKNVKDSHFIHVKGHHYMLDNEHIIIDNGLYEFIQVK